MEVCLIGEVADSVEEIAMQTFCLSHKRSAGISIFFLGAVAHFISEIICRDMRLSKEEALNQHSHLCDQRATSTVLPGGEISLSTTANFRMEMYFHVLIADNSYLL